MLENDPFAVIREARTSAGNYDLHTDGIIARLRGVAIRMLAQSNRGPS